MKTPLPVSKLLGASLALWLFAAGWPGPLCAADAPAPRPQTDEMTPAKTNAVAEDAASPVPVPNRDTATPARPQDFESFKLLYTRNIFDPNRQPSAGPGRRPVPRPKKIDGLALVGTLIYDQAAYAFFKGSEARYQTALSLSNTIDGLKLIEIGPDSVKFSAPSNSIIELALDKQLRREDEGPWQLSSSPMSWDSAPAGALSSESPSRAFTGRDSRAASSSSSGGSADDIIKRLMQKREQEMNR